MYGLLLLEKQICIHTHTCISWTERGAQGEIYNSHDTCVTGLVNQW